MTFKKAKELAKNNDCFTHKTETLGNATIHMFNYRFAMSNDFYKDDNDYTDIRGLTFVEQNNTLKKYISFNKFFNLNECKESSLERVKNLKIKKIQTKRDGSLISFMIINDTLIAKTQKSFTNKESKIAQNIVNNNRDLELFIREELSKERNPLFELTSPKNRIVLKYTDTELTLLDVRDNDGSYGIDFDLVKKYNIKIDDFLYSHLVDLTKAQLALKDVEGWVVTFVDEKGKDFKVKFKTHWYFENHKLVDSLAQEHNVIKLILNNEIDDYISELDNNELKENVLTIMKLVTNKVNYDINEFISKVNGFKGDVNSKDLYDYYKANENYLHVKTMQKFIKQKGFMKSFISEEKKRELNKLCELKGLKKGSLHTSVHFELEDFAERYITKEILSISNSLEDTLIWLEELAYEAV